MTSIFLCHSSNDNNFVRELASRLNEAGIRVWLDEAEIKIGDSLILKIGEAIDQVEFFGVILSRSSVSSVWVQRELQVAITRELKERKAVILPLLLEPVDLPQFLQSKYYADFTSSERFEESFQKLLEVIGVRDLKNKLNATEKQQLSILQRSVSQQQLVEFDNLEIVDLDIDKTYNQNPQYELCNMYLQLSRIPPKEWNTIFDEERRFPRHPMWRRAWIEGQYIIIYCVPEELENYHMQDLFDDVNNCNKKYREYLMELARQDSLRISRLQEQREKLRNIRRKLRVD